MSDPSSRPSHGGEFEVRHNPAASRFEAIVDAALSMLVYARSPRDLVLLHTEVPTSLRGRGIAGQLARSALDFAREQGLSVVPRCPFVAEYIRRHPGYADLVTIQ